MKEQWDHLDVANLSDESLAALVEVATEEADRRKVRPAFPADGVCTCGSHDWYDVEEGYSRWSSAEFDNDVLRVFQDGWDDMSEGGDARYAACAVCHLEYSLPETVSYD